MDTTNERKSEASEELEKNAEEVSVDAGFRDEDRQESERNEAQDLNQGMETGTHDARHSGIKWGPSYKVKANTAGPQK